MTVTEYAFLDRLVYTDSTGNRLTWRDFIGCRLLEKSLHCPGARIDVTQGMNHYLYTYVN